MSFTLDKSKVELANARSYRLTNIDMLRGLVILIMAIDHTRDYFMIGGSLDPMAQPDISAGLYLTRWVTHFCAPVFVFLAGTSAGLMSLRKTSNELGGFLLKRGIWLIFVELIIISTANTFSPLSGIPQMGGATVLILQVIWAIGVSMIVLSVVQYLGAKYCLVIGLMLVLGHNSLDTIWPAGNFNAGTDPFWYGLYSQTSLRKGPLLFIVVYPVIPWIGVMLIGFGSSFIFLKEPEKRDSYLIKFGLIFSAFFIILRMFDVYGDPNSWQAQGAGFLATAFDFMNVTKYPPSLLFLLITLGPMAILCGYADRLSGWLKDTLVMFGRVPFAFYIAHFYLLHLLSMLLANIQGFSVGDMATLFFFYPKGYGVSLEWVYLIWLCVIALLYPFCRWVDSVKRRRKDWWLSYL